MSSKKEVLVVGFGAVGIIYSYILKHAGRANVTCVARGNYDETKANGIHIRSRKYGHDIRGWKPDRLFSTVQEAADRLYSYVIVTTKALPEATSLPSLLAPLLSRDDPHPLPTFVILQNGLFIERDLYNDIKELGKGKPSVISSALWVGSNLLEGKALDHSHPERLYIGMYRPTYQPNVTNNAEEAAVLKDFADLLEPCGSTVHILHEIQRVKFEKNIWNAVIGSCSAISRCPPQIFFRDPELESYMVPQLQAVMKEILAIGRAMGFDEQALPSDLAETTVESTVKLYKDPGNTHRPSMLVDVELNRPMEVEVIVGELIRSAKEFDVGIPRLEFIYALLKVLQNPGK